MTVCRKSAVAEKLFFVINFVMQPLFQPNRPL
jgi:hypothetical protein